MNKEAIVNMNRIVTAATASAVIFLAGCGGGEQEASNSTEPEVLDTANNEIPESTTTVPVTTPLTITIEAPTTTASDPSSSVPLSSESTVQTLEATETSDVPAPITSELTDTTEPILPIEEGQSATFFFANEGLNYDCFPTEIVPDTHGTVSELIAFWSSKPIESGFGWAAYEFALKNPEIFVGLADAKVTDSTIIVPRCELK
jgi:hypothetical protein